MKRLPALTAIAAILALAVFFIPDNALARSYGKGTNGPKPTAEGTVTDVAGSSFQITVKDKTVTVLCDNNTKFVVDGQPAGADSIKSGVHVAIQGPSFRPDQVQAVVVVVGEPSTAKKPKK